MSLFLSSVNTKCRPRSSSPLTFVDSIDIPWYCRLNHALESTHQAALAWGGDSWDLADAKKKAYASSVLQEKLKYLSAYELNAALIDIMKQLAVDPSPVVPDGSPFQMLRTSAIKAMRTSGLIEFGAHTHTHAILSQLSFEEQRREIGRSLEEVEELTGERCAFFAYPNGHAEDYDEKSLLVLKAAGVEAALTTLPGPNETTTPLLELRRYPVGANVNLATFQLMVHHCLYDYRKTVNFRLAV